MIDTSRALASLQREFPSPRIDPAWIQACANALSDNGQDPSVPNIREQYLYSDLAASTLPSGLIPEEIHDVYLFPTPTLVQLISITEIGFSAFQLQTVQQQRKDVLSGVTRIRRMDDEEADENGEGPIEDDGRLPAYPRGMLRMEVTDGQRCLKALEHKRLAGLTLAETPLGAKLVLHNVRTLRGTMLLSPENTKYIGYEVTHLEADQPTQFTNSLLRRMGKPIPDEDEDDAQDPDDPPPPPRARAAPAAAARPPPVVAAAGPVPAHRLTIPQSSSAGPNRPRPPPPNGSNAASVPSPYFQTRPTQNAAASSSRPNTAASRRIIQITADDDEFDEEFDDSFMRQLDAAEARATSVIPKRSQAEDQSSDYGLDDFDEGMLGELEQVERQQQQQRKTGTSGSGATGSGLVRRTGSGSGSASSRLARAQYVEIEEEEDGRSGSSRTVGVKKEGAPKRKRPAEVKVEKKKWPEVIEISD